jgi:hypothetical protein
MHLNIIIDMYLLLHTSWTESTGIPIPVGSAILRIDHKNISSLSLFQAKIVHNETLQQN